MFDLLNLREVRKDAFESQMVLAKTIGVNYYAYSKYEQGKSTPSLETIYNFARHYNLSIDYILGLKDKRKEVYFRSSYNKDIIANNMKTLREKKNLSQRGLSIKLGIKQSAIERYENAKSNPSLKVLYKYYKFFKFEFDDFCTKYFS